MAIGVEAFDEALDEGFDEGMNDEAFDEAAFRPARVTTARPRPLPPRPVDRPVTQTQLQSAVTKLNSDIARNSTAIQRVNSSLTTLGRDVRRQTTAAKATRKDIGTLRDAVMLLPLLSGTLGDSNPMLSSLLPIMLLSGVGEGGQSGSGGLFGGGDGSSSLLLVLALSGAFKKS